MFTYGFNVNEIAIASAEGSEAALKAMFTLSSPCRLKQVCISDSSELPLQNQKILDQHKNSVGRSTC